MIILLFAQALGFLSNVVSVDKKTVTYSGDQELTQDYVREGGYTQYKKIIVSNGITGIGLYCFQRCTALTEITLPTSCEYLSSYCFQQCSKLLTIDLPEGLKTIGKAVFQQCTVLNTISFPSTITNCETQQTFQTCYKLSKFITKNTGLLSSNSDNSILIFNKTRLLAFSNTKSTLTIPKEIEVIAEYAGSYVTALKTVIFETNSSLKILERGLFRYTSISSLHIPEGVLEIYENLIESASQCTTVSLPSSLTYVSNDIFRSALNLNTVNINNSIGAKRDEDGLIINQDNVILFASKDMVKMNITKDISEVPTSLIQLLPNLTTLTVSSDHPTLSATENLLYKGLSLIACPGGLRVAYVRSNCTTVTGSAFALTQIERVYFNGTAMKTFAVRSFEKTYNLVYLQIPPNLETINIGAFQNCGLNCELAFSKTLKTVKYTAFTYSQVTKLDFSLCVNLETIEYEFARGCNELVSVILPPNLASIKYDSFKSSKSLTSIEIPKKVMYIEMSAFFDCSSLQSVTFEAGSSLQNISSMAFKNCNLLELSIPDSVRMIETEAFYGNALLTKLEFGEDSLLEETFAFMIQGCDSLPKITFGKHLKNIKPTSLSMAKSLTEISISKNNKNYQTIDGMVYSSDLQKFVVCPGGVSMPEIRGNVISFVDAAFYGCSKVVSIEFGDVPLQSIGESAFYGCSSLASIEVPSSVTEICANAFYGCTALKEVTMKAGSGLATLQSGAFAGCTDLRRVIFEEGSQLVSVGVEVFKNCRELSEFTFPPLLKSIGVSAFEGCGKLANITFFGLLESIGSRAFFGCDSLFHITFPDSLKSLGADSFASCEELFALTYCGTNDLSKYSAFSNSPYAVAYVSANYSAASFGGLKPVRTLDNDCNLPTLAFTANAGSGPLSPSLVIAVMPITKEENAEQ